MEAIVIATNRPEVFKEWFKQWGSFFLSSNNKDVKVYVMVDTEDFAVQQKVWAEMIGVDREAFSHLDVKKLLGENAWIIPRKSSACKSFAIYQAWKDGADRIYCLDDDCYPLEDYFIQRHKANLAKSYYNDVLSTMRGARPRGTPYSPPGRVMLSHGMWKGVPDVDGLTQLNGYSKDIKYVESGIPKGCLFPFSGMNWACNREIAPLMYFGLHGEGYPYDRFDDIWCGFILKPILDRLNYVAYTGRPFINHIRESDPFDNIQKESAGYRANVTMCELMRDFRPQGDTVIECLEEVVTYFRTGILFDERLGNYLVNYSDALLHWVDLFKKGEVK